MVILTLWKFKFFKTKSDVFVLVVIHLWPEKGTVQGDSFVLLRNQKVAVNDEIFLYLRYLTMVWPNPMLSVLDSHSNKNWFGVHSPMLVSSTSSKRQLFSIFEVNRKCFTMKMKILFERMQLANDKKSNTQLSDNAYLVIWLPSLEMTFSLYSVFVICIYLYQT